MLITVHVEGEETKGLGQEISSTIVKKRYHLCVNYSTSEEVFK